MLHKANSILKTLQQNSPNVFQADIIGPANSGSITTICIGGCQDIPSQEHNVKTNSLSTHKEYTQINKSSCLCIQRSMQNSVSVWKTSQGSKEIDH